MLDAVGAKANPTREHDLEPFRVLATCGGFVPGHRYGGPVRSLVQIVESISESIDLTLVTRDRDLATPTPYPGLSGRWVMQSGARVFYLTVSRAGQWRQLRREFRDTSFDLLYVNSLFSMFSLVPIIAARLGVLRVSRILVAPRGELSPGSLSLKRRKKQVFLRFWLPLLRTLGVVWHATSDREAESIRRACPWAQIEINRSQVSLPYEPLPPGPVAPGPARLVFISRISPEKNLILVLRALQQVSTPMDLDIYGPMENVGYWEKCQNLFARLPTTVQVRYCGELAADEVRSTFARYDAFVFPTLGENFGHVIAESLSASCPVICSDQTPWTDLLTAGGGAVLKRLTVDDLAGQLERFAALDQVARAHARRAAGDAYRSWRRRVDGPNILEQARRASWVRPGDPIHPSCCGADS
ncbi:glycosyltransferase [Micromonospora sp. NBC_01739]|uniref:glycosyltransferase n=1 Tax=Micromonospora sp. NBC_01739 TaxID=2975985 RepID=UPI002E15FBEC|nr:glycosyltransferase [Micromonospora sp. NBC_01739]